MSLLLDTHVFLWWQAELVERMGSEAHAAISGADSVYVSSASVWEVSIKSALGKLRLPVSVAVGAEESGFEKLPILFSHAQAAGALPRHHRDPFDRMLVAQAQLEGLTLVTHDGLLKPYDVQIIWAG